MSPASTLKAMTHTSSLWLLLQQLNNNHSAKPTWNVSFQRTPQEGKPGQICKQCHNSRRRNRLIAI